MQKRSKEEPRFSIIICTYERPLLLPRAIRSVLSQCFTNFEVVVVDDGSKADTGKILASFEDQRIRFFRKSQNRGMAHSVNLALTKARGEYTVFLDDDDEFTPGALSKIDLHLKRTGVDFCWGGIREFFVDGQPPDDKVVLLKSSELRERQMVAILIGTGFAFTMRTDLPNETRYMDENLKSCTDVDLFLNLVQGPYRWSGLPDILVHVHRQTNRLTLPGRRYANSVEYIIQKHQQFLDTHEVLKSVLYFHWGRALADAGERKETRRVLGKYLLTNPSDIRALTLFISNEMRHSWLGLKLLTIYRWFYHRKRKRMSR